MKKVFLILSCLLVLSSSPAWAVEEPTVVVVRVSESAYGVSFIIARGTEKPESVVIEAPRKLDSDELSAFKYQHVLAKLYAQGYVLQSTVSGAPTSTQPTASNSTLIFVKAPKP